MDNEFDDFAQGERKTLSPKFPSAVNLILVIVVVIAAIVSIGELTLTLKGAVNITLTVIVLYIVASIVYPNSYMSGIAREKLTNEYISAKAEYDAAVKEIGKSGMLADISEYCLRYSKEELKACRASILLDECIEYDTFEKEYLGVSIKDLRDKKLSPAAIKCIRDANRVKALDITPGSLMSTGEDVTLLQRILRIIGVRRTVGIEARTRQRIDYSTNMVIRAVTTLLAGVVGITVVIEDFSLRTIAEWAMKMLPIPIAALGGNNAGRRNVSDTLIPQLLRKTKIIHTMLGWHAEKYSQVTQKPQLMSL